MGKRDQSLGEGYQVVGERQWRERETTRYTTIIPKFSRYLFYASKTTLVKKKKTNIYKVNRNLV